jgi:ribonucleoside-diphosphate reductase alpha chain
VNNIISADGSIIDPYRNFIAVSRYARWLDDKGRRETWEETVDRYMLFMRTTIADNQSFIMSDELYEELRFAILNHKVMPSMRALMTAGPALERDNLAGYNCSFLVIDSPRAFDEGLYVLLAGTGLGFSVAQEDVSKMPAVADELYRTDSTIVVADSKLGWAKALKELVAMLYAGQIPFIDTSKVRPAGARLKTFGGRASGPEPLQEVFDFFIDLFKKAAGRRLTTLECHDLMCKIANSVVVGGVRRAAMISLSDLGDGKMARAKNGDWYTANGQRALANNSAIYTEKPDIVTFIDEFGNLIESKSGERGIFNLDSIRKHIAKAGRREFSQVRGVNPCGEIPLRTQGLCNLTEVVIEEDDTEESVRDKVRLATILGTFQSTLTNFKYLRKGWRENAEEERLLGVSMTGQFGNSLFNGSKGLDVLAATLDTLREHAIDVNREYAKALGINQSAAITTVKPSGTVSQLVMSSSGMHPWHNDYYLRSVRASNRDPLTQFLKDSEIPNEPCVMKPEDTTVFYFPTKAPEGSITRNNISAIEHLEIWRVYRNHWTEHNPSVTISVKEDEWLDVAAWVYKNWDDVAGISFLPYSDHVYKQAPYQDVTQEEYEAWLDKMPNEIHWSLLGHYEEDDNTEGSSTLACSAGGCEVVDVGSNK